jgi:hypothetical protein
MWRDGKQRRIYQDSLTHSGCSEGVTRKYGAVLFRFCPHDAVDENVGNLSDSPQEEILTPRVESLPIFSRVRSDELWNI